MTQQYKAKNILVTGAAGFIGSNFVRYLLETDPAVNVISYDKLTYAGDLKNLENLSSPERHTFIKGDICDADIVKKTLQEYNIDTIVHFAAESHVDRSITGPTEFIQTNLVGTFTLLEAAKQYWLDEQQYSEHDCRFHHISTDEVYGSLSKDDPAFSEKTAYEPNSPYSASKAGSDHLVRAYQHTYQLPTTMTNCSNNYGPYQHPEKFIPTVIRSCLENKPIPIYGDGSNIRDWLFVTDHCDAIDKVIQTGEIGESYNVGGRAERTNLQVVNSICELMNELLPVPQDYKNLITFVEDRKGHDWRYAIDDHKINQQLGWQPSIEFLDGLKVLIEGELNK